MCPLTSSRGGSVVSESKATTSFTVTEPINSGTLNAGVDLSLPGAERDELGMIRTTWKCS